MSKSNKPSRAKTLRPELKIIISVAVIALILLTIELDSSILILSILKKAVSIIAFFYSIVTFFKALSELRNTPKAIAKSKAKSARVPREEQQTLAISSVLNFLRGEHIVEIDAVTDNGITRFGTASDYNRNKDIFFDKRYYLEEEEYQSPEEMEEALHEAFPYGVITIARIDGVAPKHFKIT